MYGIGVKDEFEVDERGDKCLANIYDVADSVNGAYLNITTALSHPDTYNAFESAVLYTAQ